MKDGVDVEEYIEAQVDEPREICSRLKEEIIANLPEAEYKIWHAHPVWFLNENPTVGFSKLKDGVRLMFWSGADFDEPELKPGTGKFMDASITYQSADQINSDDMKRWIEKSQRIQWDYKNLIKRRGKLERIT